MLEENKVEAVDGGYYEVRPDTLFIYGDNPNAVQNLRLLRLELKKVGIGLSAFDRG